MTAMASLGMNIKREAGCKSLFSTCLPPADFDREYRIHVVQVQISQKLTIFNHLFALR